MYNTKELEKYASMVYGRFSSFNLFVLQKIGNRIKSTGRLSAADQQALKNMCDVTGDMEAITKELAKITKTNISDVKKIYETALSDISNGFEPIFNYKNIEYKSFADDEFAQAIIDGWVKNTAGTMINISRTKALGFVNESGRFESIQGAYQRVMDEAVQAVTTGTSDFNTAMEHTVSEIGGSGLQVDYGNGVHRSIESVVRANILYGTKKAAQSYDNYISNEILSLGAVEIDAHAGCRPTHIPIQGQIYTLKNESETVDGTEYKSFYAQIYTGEKGQPKSAADLMDDYGCLHFATGFMLGVSQPTYSKEELKRIKEETERNLEYKGIKKTLYQWKQKQRELERNVRKTELKAKMLEASGNSLKAKKTMDFAHRVRAEYMSLSKSIPGLEPHPERMNIYSVNSNKSIDKSGKSGIININNNIHSPIEQRNTGKGNPNAILQIGRPLNNRQKKLLDSLNEYDSRVIVNKKSVNMKDLSALTAVTGDEFALFTRGKKRLVIRGNSSSVNIDTVCALELSKQGYKWSGHTHPGVEPNSSMPSGGDKEILSCFKHGTSVIYDSKGRYRTFEKE